MKDFPIYGIGIEHVKVSLLLTTLNTKYSYNQNMLYSHCNSRRCLIYRQVAFSVCLMLVFLRDDIPDFFTKISQLVSGNNLDVSINKRITKKQVPDHEAHLIGGLTLLLTIIHWRHEDGTYLVLAGEQYSWIGCDDLCGGL